MAGSEIEDDKIVLAYLAGAMDADGYFTIKKHTYAMRVRKDATQAMYSERIGPKQVTPDVPKLLKTRFGGSLALTRPQSKNSKPLWSWGCSDAQAARACGLLLPYLRIKKRQTELLLELRESKGRGYSRLAYWFEKNYPRWRSMDMITSSEVAHFLNYKNILNVSQAARNGSLLALPWDHRAVETPRFPKALVVEYARHQARSRDGRGRVRPPQLMAWRERLFQGVRELNRLGVDGTPTYRREGVYQPK